MSEDIKITYETLFDLLRREKSREDIQNLEATFFNDIITYLGEKMSMLKEQEQKSDLLSSASKEKTRNQLENIRKLITELYERREKKIINMALNQSRTNTASIDTTPLVKDEKIFFDGLVALFNAYRDGILSNILNLKRPEVAKLETFQKTEAKAEQKEEKAPDELYSEPEQIKSSESAALGSGDSSELSKKESETARIIFLNNVEQFIGPDLEPIGPFKADEEAELPKMVADVLVKRGDAEKV